MNLIIKLTGGILYCFPILLLAKLDLSMPDYDPNDYNQMAYYVPNKQYITKNIDSLRKMRKKLKVVEDPELIEWINQLGQRLESHIKLPYKLSFFLVNSPKINAFATPHGGVFINTGLVLHAKTESELAGVIAHEIAHISQNHIQRIKQKSKQQLLESGAIIVAGIATASQNLEAGNALVGVGIATGFHRKLSFSRNMEREADRIGIKILAASGFNVQAMPRYLERLDNLSSSNSEALTQFLRSHPLSIQRISDTRVRANIYTKRGKNSEDFGYMREKIRQLYHAINSERTSDSSKKKIKNYSLARKYFKLDQLKAAMKLLPNKVSHLTEALLKVEVLNAMHRYDEALGVLMDWRHKGQLNTAYQLLLAKTYLGKGMKEKAWLAINRGSDWEYVSIHFFETQQYIAAINKKEAFVSIALAERMKRLGRYHYARQHYQHVLNMQSITPQLRKRVLFKLKQLPE